MTQFPANQPTNPMMDISPDMGLGDEQQMSMGDFFGHAGRRLGFPDHPILGLPTNATDAEAQNQANEAGYASMNEEPQTINNQVGQAERGRLADNKMEAALIAAKAATMDGLRNAVARNNGNINKTNKELQ